MHMESSWEWTGGCITWYQPYWMKAPPVKVHSLCNSLFVPFSLSSLSIVDQPQGTLSCVHLPSISVSSLWWRAGTPSAPMCLRYVHLYRWGNSPQHIIGFLSLACIDCFTERQIMHWYCTHTFFKCASVCVCACMCVLLIPGGLSHSSLSD